MQSHRKTLLATVIHVCSYVKVPGRSINLIAIWGHKPAKRKNIVCITLWKLAMQLLGKGD